MASKKDAERDEAIANLKRIVKKGDKLYTVIAHVSTSGMRREINLYKITNQGETYLSSYAAKALGRTIGNRSGVICNGAGMSMTFELVYSLAQKLFGDGYALTHRDL